MTSLKKLLAYNMKEQRHILGISQAALAERIDTSTHYIAMIELERKTPSLLMLERIATALQIDPPELFSMRSIPSNSLKTMQKTVLMDIEQAIDHVISKHIKAMEDNGEQSDNE
jgi:transcriptional regulator with XRE-family HTH domain